MGCMQVFVWICFFEHDRMYAESGEHPVKSTDGVAVKYGIWRWRWRSQTNLYWSIQGIGNFMLLVPGDFKLRSVYTSVKFSMGADSKAKAQPVCSPWSVQNVQNCIKISVKTLTCDTQVYGYDPKIKQHSPPQPKTAWQVQRKTQEMDVNHFPQTRRHWAPSICSTRPNHKPQLLLISTDIIVMQLPINDQDDDSLVHQKFITTHLRYQPNLCSNF
jgi:hypothetical protein